MTNAARDDREIAPYDMTLAGGPEGLALAPEGDPTDLAYYTREQVGPDPEDVRWTPITDPAAIAAIEGAVAQGIDPPYEVWAVPASPPGEDIPTPGEWRTRHDADGNVWRPDADGDVFLTRDRPGVDPEGIVWRPDDIWLTLPRLDDPATIERASEDYARLGTLTDDEPADFRTWAFYQGIALPSDSASLEPAALGPGEPAALGPGDLALTPTPTPAEEGPALYAWEQTGPSVGEGQLYEVTDPVVIAAYEEAHPAQGAVEIANPAEYDEAAAVPSQEPVPDLTPGAALDRDLTPALDL